MTPLNIIIRNLSSNCQTVFLIMPTPRLSMPWQRHLPRALLISLLSITGSCITPSQRFEPGSPADLLANPPWSSTEISEISHKQWDNHTVRIGVLDYGYDLHHPDLLRNYLPRYEQIESAPPKLVGTGLDLAGGSPNQNFDFFPHFPVIDENEPGQWIDRTNLDESFQNHGTRVAYLAHQQNPNIAIVPIRVLPLSEAHIFRRETLRFWTQGPGRGTFGREYLLAAAACEQIAIGLRALRASRVRIINISLGINARAKLNASEQKDIFDHYFLPLNRMIARDFPNTLITVAAGNESIEVHDELDSYPAGIQLPNVIVVGAWDSRNQGSSNSHHPRAEFSNWGPRVSHCAPGVDIVSPHVRGQAGERSKESGTSFASPIVAQRAATLWLRAPHASVEQVRRQISAEFPPCGSASRDQEHSRTRH